MPPSKKHNRGCNKCCFVKQSEEFVNCCLHANNTFICTTYNPKYYIIRKVLGFSIFANHMVTYES